MPDAYSSWAQYTVRFPDSEKRERAIQSLKENKIPSAVYYVKPLHLQKAFENIQMKGVNCKVTEMICNTCLSLPMHAYMQIEDIEMVCEILLKEMI